MLDVWGGGSRPAEVPVPVPQLQKAAIKRFLASEPGSASPASLLIKVVPSGF